MYLPDANVFIKALYGVEPDASFLRKAIEKKRLYVSVVSIAEFFAKTSQKEKEKFEQLLAMFPNLPVDLEVAKLAAEYRTQFLRKRRRIFLLDCFLAAQAKINHLTLVTNNRSDFPMKDVKVISP